MSNRRARRADPDTEQLVKALTQALLMRRPQEPAQLFKTPQYTDIRDVEYFIARFQKVADANCWKEGATLLHLQALVKRAEDCGQVESPKAALNTFRARFVPSARQALSRLSVLQQNENMPLQEHAMEVERLVHIAYEDLPNPHRNNMTMEVFCSSLGDPAFQQHFLAVPHPR